jgi:hypothetical protein
MGTTVFFMVQPYEKGRGGELYARQPIPAQNEIQARRLARSLNCAGAVAYSRACDPDLGEYEDAVILLVVGQVPEAA